MKVHEALSIPLRDTASLDVRPRAIVRTDPNRLPGLVEGGDDLDSFHAVAFRLHSFTAGTSRFSTEGTRDPLHVILLRYAREPQDQFTAFLPGRIASAVEVRQSIEWGAASLGLLELPVITLRRSEAALS